MIRRKYKKKKATEKETTRSYVIRTASEKVELKNRNKVGAILTAFREASVGFLYVAPDERLHNILYIRRTHRRSSMCDG